MHKIIKIILPIFLACGIFNAADGSNYGDDGDDDASNYGDYDDDAIPPNKPENPANKLEKFNNNHKNLIQGWIMKMDNNPETKTTFTEFNDCLAKERKILLSIITLLRSIDPNIEDIGDCHQIHDLYIAASTIKDDIECMLKVTEILDRLHKNNDFQNHLGDDLKDDFEVDRYYTPEKLRLKLKSGKIILFMIGYKYLKYIDNAEKLKKIEELPSLIKLKNELKESFSESKWKSDWYSPSRVTDIIIKFNIINYLIESNININEKKNSITLSPNLDYRKKFEDSSFNNFNNLDILNNNKSDIIKNTLRGNSSLSVYQSDIKNKNPVLKKRLENHNAALFKEMKSLVDIIMLLRSSSIKDSSNTTSASMDSQGVKVRFRVNSDQFISLKKFADLKDDIECMARVSAQLSYKDTYEYYNEIYRIGKYIGLPKRYRRYQIYYLMFFYKFIKYQYNKKKSFKYRDKLFDMLNRELDKKSDDLNKAYSIMAKTYYNQSRYNLTPFLQNEMIYNIQRFMQIYDLIELEKNKNSSDIAYDDDDDDSDDDGDDNF